MNHDRCFGCMSPLDGPVCPRCGWGPEDRNDPHQLPAGTELAGRYLLGRVLGQGGYGITYLGWDLEEERTVCIKEFYPSGISNRDTAVSLEIDHNTAQQEPLFEAGKARFLREAQALSLFRETPQVVTLYGTLEENGTAYMIMEFIRGFDLHQYMRKREHPLTMDETLRILQPVAEALMMIHKEELVHRDIAPDNIMLHPIEGAKLLDFGAVRLVEDAGANKELDKSTEMILKNGFAPTEQYASRGSLGPWTDVYAFSATIYYCLTKRIPENAPIRMLENDTLDWTGAVGITENQKKVLEKGLAVRIPDRIPSVQALIEALKAPEAFQKPDMPPVPDPKPPVPDPKPPASKKKMRKGRGPGILIAILVLLTLVVGMAGSYLIPFVLAGRAAERKDFLSAQRLLWLPSLTECHDPQLITFINAGSQLDMGAFDVAKMVFQELNGYRNSETMVLECDYRKVLSLIGQEEYDDAIALLPALAAQNYADTPQLLSRTLILHSRKLFSDGRYSSSYEVLLPYADDPDIQAELDALKPKIYATAQQLYRDSKLIFSQSLFELLGDYEDSGKYLRLIPAVSFTGYTDAKAKVETLFELFGFEDASEVLLRYTYPACWALLGEWTSSSGEDYIRMWKDDPADDTGFLCSWSFPTTDNARSYFDVKNGDFVGVYRNKETPLFHVTFLSPDTLEVYCYANSTAYILHKKAS